TPFVSFYPGQGDGTLGSPIASAPGTFLGLGASPGDVDHDGNLDLIGDGFVAFGNGDGTFVRMVSSPACNGSDFATAGFHRDGNPDLAIMITNVAGGAFLHIEEVAASVCLGNGTGAFAAGPLIYS